MKTGDFDQAVRDFQRARRRADLEKVLASWKGKSTDLLSFEEVKKTLKITGSSSRGLQEIPIDRIVGSVGRYSDFSRTFLPKEDHHERRWARVKTIATGVAGFPPIEVYKIDRVYFVIDGNHRVSIARQMQATLIEAFVTELRTPIKLSPDMQPDDLIITAEYKEFLDHIPLDEYRDGVDFSVTAPGKYRVLEERIASHYRWMESTGKKEDLSLKEAAIDWYDTLYLPTARTIEERGLLRDFPNRTIADLYVWMLQYWTEIKQQLGWKVHPETAAREFVRQHGAKKESVVSRIKEKVSDILTPAQLDAGPDPGAWRKEMMAIPREGHLFTNILAPLSGSDRDWCALDLACKVARKEQSGYIQGLHIVVAEEQRASEETLTVKETFENMCRDACVEGKLAIEAAENVPRKICERSRWTDLLVLHVAHPPGRKPLARLKSQIRTIIRLCPRPILAVPETITKIDRVLLAYDGNPKSNEALYLSAYLAGQFKLLLTVVCVEDERVDSETLDAARDYLHERKVHAEYVQTRGAVGESILNTAEEQNTDLIVMGGYGYRPMLELVLGSKLDDVLRRSRQPVLMCH